MFPPDTTEVWVISAGSAVVRSTGVSSSFLHDSIRKTKKKIKKE